MTDHLLARSTVEKLRPRGDFALLLPNRFAEIEQERAAAKAALSQAETRMKETSRDPEAFRAAKADREAAAEALERLDWAEKAEHERQAQDSMQAKVDAMQEAQRHARTAGARALELVGELEPLIVGLSEKVRELREAQAAVDRGVHYEQFGVRDGYLKRQTIVPRLSVDGQAAVRILIAGRELAKLAGIPAQTAEMKAAQGKL